MTRQRLPNRRPCVTYDRKILGINCTISYGYQNLAGIGGVKEVFIDAAKSGEMMESIMRDQATITSIALQHGATPEELAKSLTRNTPVEGDEVGLPASPIGVVLDDMVMG